MCFLLFVKIKQDTNQDNIIEERTSKLFNSIDKTNTAHITKYSIYGTHFNLEGTLDIIKLSGINVSYVDLILKNINGDEIRY